VETGESEAVYRGSENSVAGFLREYEVES